MPTRPGVSQAGGALPPRRARATGSLLLSGPVSNPALKTPYRGEQLSAVRRGRPFPNATSLALDTTGRDVLARLLYGFRYAHGFLPFCSLFSTYLIMESPSAAPWVISAAGSTWGSSEVIEIWANMPTLATS